MQVGENFLLLMLNNNCIDKKWRSMGLQKSSFNFQMYYSNKKRTMSYCYSSYVDGLLLIRCNIEELERIDKNLIHTLETTLLKNASLYIKINIIHIWLKVSLGGTTKNITSSFHWTTLIFLIIFYFMVQYLINLFIVFHYPNCGFLNGPH